MNEGERPAEPMRGPTGAAASTESVGDPDAHDPVAAGEGGAAAGAVLGTVVGGPIGMLVGGALGAAAGGAAGPSEDDGDLDDPKKGEA